MTITNQPSGPARKSAPPPPPSRLPAARERRPALAALAVLLIVGGAAGAGWLALREGQTTPYLVVSKEVPLGTEFEADDFDTVELPDTALDLVPASEREQIVGQYAQTLLEPGTILNQSFVGDEPKDPDGTQTVGYSLSPGQYPITMLVGDTVRLTVTRSNDATPITTTGLVRSIKSSDTGDNKRVDIVISETCNDEFATSDASSNMFVSTIASSDQLETCSGGGRRDGD